MVDGRVDDRRVLRAVASKCERMHLQHHAVSSRYAKLHGLLQVPAALLSGASSAITFAASPGGYAHRDELYYLVGVLTGIAALLHGLIASCAFNRRSDAHRRLAQDCYALLHRVRSPAPAAAPEDAQAALRALEERAATPLRRPASREPIGLSLSPALTAPGSEASGDSPPEP